MGVCWDGHMSTFGSWGCAGLLLLNDTGQSFVLRLCGHVPINTELLARSPLVGLLLAT